MSDPRAMVLVEMLDRLGADGAWYATSGMTVEQLQDELYQHVLHLEWRARCEAMLSVIKAADDGAYARIARETLEARMIDDRAEYRGGLPKGAADKRYEARLRDALLAMVRR